MLAGKLELELLAIRTLCAQKDAGLILLNSLTPASFHYPTTSLMYRRLMARLKGEGHVPAWDDLLNDPTVPEEKRQNAQRIVRKKNLKPLVSKSKGEALFTSLDNYRKLRAFYEMLNKAGNAVRQPTASIDDVIKAAKSELIAIDVNHRGSPITVDGLTGTHIIDALTNAAARIRTGLKEFDERSGGIPQGAVMLLGADTGGYKSVQALQIAQNMARNKHRVGFYSLEMVLEEITQRATANVTETNVSDLVAEYINDLHRAKTPAEVEKIKAKQIKIAQEKAREYEEASKEWSEFLHITCPAEEVDINWILQQAEMSDREVIIIDYVGLLAGLSGDDQWRAMSNVVRQCKIWCNRTGKTVLILAQMRFEEGKPELKYSKAILDHCNNAWGWSKLEVDGRTYLCVHQMKARAQRQYAFILRAWPEFNKIGDLVDLKDEEVARAALEDMKVRKDPAKRYEKTVNGNEEKGRRDIDLDDDKVIKLQDGGFGGHKKVRAHDISGDPPWEDSSSVSRRSNTIVSAVGQRVSSSAIRKAANLRNRTIALSKLNSKSGNLSLEEAGIQAEEVLRRWQEATIGHRIEVDKLAKEILGLSTTKEILTQVRRLQGDKAAIRKLSKQELEIHRAQVEVINEAASAIKAKGREYVSEEDFYAVDDLTLAVERGEEPIASPRTLDQPWQNNAVAWADQPAITLPNSAKPQDRRWGFSGEEESVKRFKRKAKAFENSGGVSNNVMLWPPKAGKLHDYLYLDDIQLDTAVGIAEKYASRPLVDVSLDQLASDIAQYIELLGPGRARINSRKRKRVILNDETYKAACKKLGVSYV